MKVFFISFPGLAASPFPEVDEFVFSLVSSGGGSFRRVAWRPRELAVEYEVAGNRSEFENSENIDEIGGNSSFLEFFHRFCRNVGRQHRSNNVKYVVLLNRGIFFQVK